MATVEQNAADIVLIKQELARTITLLDYYDQMTDAEAIQHASALLRNFGLQVYTNPSSNEVALWTYDKASKVAPGEVGYSGTKVFVITAGS